LNINTEGSLLSEIKDIIDEIYILTRILLQQKHVVEAAVRHIKESLLPRFGSGPAWHPIISLYEEGYDHELESFQNDHREAARLTLARSDHLLNDVHERIEGMRTLEENAQKTASAVIKFYDEGIWE
jgi:hypothetical protein